MRMQFENGQKLPSVYDILHVLVAESDKGVHFVGLRILDKTSSIEDEDLINAKIAGYHSFKPMPPVEEICSIAYGDNIPELGEISHLPVEKIVFMQGEPVWHKQDENGQIRVISKYEGAVTRTLMFKHRPDRDLVKYFQARIDKGVKVKYVDFEFGDNPTGFVLPDFIWDGEFSVEGFTPAGDPWDDEVDADAQEAIDGWLCGCRLTKSGRAVDDAQETDDQFHRMVRNGTW